MKKRFSNRSSLSTTVTFNGPINNIYKLTEKENKKRYDRRTKQTLIFMFGVLCLFTRCMVCSPPCVSEIRNQSIQNIYIILKPANNADIRLFKPLLNASRVSKFKLDTLANTGTFMIAPGGHLLTYDGPGDNPARLLGYLKIIANHKIIELQSQDEINDLYDKEGILYTMMFK